MSKSCLAAVLVLVSLPAAAQAHQLHVFAQADGARIEGQAYFTGGSPAKNVSVVARDATGRELTRTTTDALGNFHFTAQCRCDHRLLVDAGDGHAAEYTVSAAELAECGTGSASVPPGPNTGKASATQPLHLLTPAPSREGKESMSTVSGEESLPAQIQAMRRQLAALREQLDGYEQHVRLHDILGGLGYIVGLTGAVFYVLGRRKAGEKSEIRSSKSETNTK